ncbi:hypothetical protein KBI52_04510 [Microvirga sp. HBU67558]|uniref:hypothetical protein n=1 Tax=Microvirga TaxID=186650 RepID=UPI001B36B308|nr:MULTISPECIES: hypothetical protein [unclassified Microvirga]MBQ0819485.1 hypothetical protein [Microvirga sp. HBU67558]
MDIDDTLDPDDVETRTVQAFTDAEAAGERAEAIDKIGTLICEQLETACWPETKDLLANLLNRCRDLFEVAYADQEDARQRYEEAMRDGRALRGE